MSKVDAAGGVVGGEMGVCFVIVLCMLEEEEDGCV